MRVPCTQQAIERLEENDSFLFACMGLIRNVSRFDCLLAQLIGPARRPVPEEQNRRELLQIALGIIALRLQLGVQLARVADEISMEHASPVDGVPASSELLR